MTGAPIPAVLAVVRRGSYLLLVRRRNPPDAGLWGFPGGRLEWGETAAQAAARELLEETGLRSTDAHILTALDCIVADEADEVAFHFLLVAVLCRADTGDPVAADDACEVG